MPTAKKKLIYPQKKPEIKKKNIEIDTSAEILEIIDEDKDEVFIYPEKKPILVQKKIDKIPKNKFYGLNFDNLFLNEAIKNIKSDPTRYLTLFIKKTVSFLFIDINSPNPDYYNPLHYIPVLLFGITALIGIGLSDKKSYKLNYLILIFFFYVFIFSTVSILPRYKLIILPIQIIFTSVLIESIKKLIYQRK